LVFAEMRTKNIYNWWILLEGAFKTIPVDRFFIKYKMNFILFPRLPVKNTFLCFYVFLFYRKFACGLISMNVFYGLFLSQTKCFLNLFLRKLIVILAWNLSSELFFIETFWQWLEEWAYKNLFSTDVSCKRLLT
jgi:hypothetical protein